MNEVQVVSAEKQVFECVKPLSAVMSAVLTYLLFVSLETLSKSFYIT